MKKNFEIKAIYWFIIVLFACFLVLPLGSLLIQSFQSQGNFSFANYIQVIGEKGFLTALQNSFLVSGLSALITTFLAFMMAYAIHYTNIPLLLKKFMKNMTMLPMLLPTITYGFAIIYSFGKQGLWTKVFGHQLFDIYGMSGLLLGYVIYTLPIAFMLIHNAMEYIDKKFIIVSKLMDDNSFKTFVITLLKPMLGTLAAAFIQAFFLSFTDFGIPASVGGQFEVVASVLYNQMLGSIPNFANGAVVAMIMLLPSVLSIALLHYLERYNIRYNKISTIEFKKNALRDVFWSLIGLMINVFVLAIFMAIFIVPFIQMWPYDMSLTLNHVEAVLMDPALIGVIENSLIVAILTAITGTFVVYGAALAVARSSIHPKLKKVIETIALVTNTVPGMVIGIAYLLIFSGSPIQNTFVIIIVCNIVHFFSSPYLMMKNSLMKMNAGYETTARLMGDSWFKTILRVVTPNALSSLLEVFSYYFMNAMVTVSAVIFIAGARTMVMTTKIKELQHFAKFNEIFVLSIFIFIINFIAKGLFYYFTHRKKREKTK
ncbi:ABC transporter permease subunit [Candidatus Stoquefichus massiliensis]|uniref:ABC transporter permease subunit n=1 Tax=Candidatus Stoquefichus massiliensis TaxID=1470350 RepID=UPI00048862AF|nr:ABC transporter permease subunit [Candidatus Stoquefichus massiliensis]